jgi:molecular chaperone GrpE
MSSQTHRQQKENPQEDQRPENAASADPRAAEPGTEQIGGESAVADQIKRLQVEKQELMDTLVRRQADFENYRKRIERERHQDRHRGVESLVEHLLPVLDAFDRALAESNDSAYLEYRKGFELIRRQIWETLAKQGLVRIDALGQEFNPHFHHAIERVETTEHQDGIVIDQLQPGYTFHEKVLRPAMVRVAAAPQTEAARRSSQND